MDILCNELQEVAERVFQNLPKLHNTIVNISPGTSKPVWEEMSVLMGNGTYKKLKKIRVGDCVIGKSGRPCEVSGVHIQGELPTIQITTKGGRKLVAALDHPVLSPNGWVNIGEITVGQRVVVFQNKPKSGYGSDTIIKTENFRPLPCRCLTVENDASFIVDGIVVHNSSLCSILFPAWVWTRMPHARIITASHTSDLVMDLSNKSRHVIKSDEYRRLFPDIEISEDQDSKHYFSNTKGGDRFTCTVGGRSPIGMHAHFQICLPWETLIETDYGPQPIGRIVDYKLPLRVLGFNTETRTFSWQHIEAYEANKGRLLYKLQFSDNIYLELTEDHPVYINNKGYVPALHVVSGDQVLFIDRKDKKEGVLYTINNKTVVANRQSDRVLKSVYNLRTDLHHNFFANGVLVHNCDDPLDPKKAASEAEIKNAQEFFDAVLPGRMVDKSITVLFLVMQRLHDEDPTGYLLAKAKRAGSSKIRHICLPAEITDSKTRASVSPPDLLEFYDKDGLMDPIRLPATVLNEKKADGIYAFSAQYLQCLVGSSLILTDKGLVPICDVTQNNLVLTRQGWKKVLWSGETGQTNKLSAVLFSNGSVVIGTGNHPVWCVDKGWVALDDLSKDDICLTCVNYREIKQNGLRGFSRSISEEAPLARASLIKTPTHLLMDFHLLYHYEFKFKSISNFISESIKTFISDEDLEDEDLSILVDDLYAKFIEDTSDSIKNNSMRISIGCSSKNDSRVCVYDLTIEDAPEFFANGILVHNSPTPPEGGMFKAHWFSSRCKAAPYQCKRVVYVDRAFTANKHSCNTAVTLMGEYENNFYVGPVWVGKWEPDERDRIILMVAQQCRDRFGPRYEPTIVIEQEPSAGVDSYRHLAKKLNGFKVQADPARSNKELRADPFASQCAAGNVFLVDDGDWDIKGWVEELTHFPLAKYKDRTDSACLIAGTLVETKDGSKPIETITANDFVLTRQGYKKVLWSGQSGLVAHLIKVEFSNGSELIGTPEHLVWTLQRGFIRMDSLVETDTVLFYKDILWENYQESKTQHGSKSFNLKESFTIVGKKTVTFGDVVEQNPYTDQCGNFIMEVFPKDIISTTEMETEEIITSRTLNVSHQKNTPYVIQINGLDYKSTSTTFVKKLRNGTDRRKVGNGIGKIANKFLLNDFPNHLLVTIAKYCFIQNTMRRIMGRDFAQSRVVINNEKKKGNVQPQRKYAHLVKNTLWAKRNPFIVLDHVLPGGDGINAHVPVYDLCVEDAHEFFANGILVHNSGAYNWLTKNTRKVNAGQFFILKSRQRQDKLRVAFCSADLLTTIVLEEPTIVILVKSPDLPTSGRSAKLGNYFRGRSAKLLEVRADLPITKNADLPYLASAHLIAHTMVTFADLNPKDLQQIWDQPLSPWNQLPADLVMSQQHAKQIWACLTRQRTNQPTTILICGEGGIPQSLALGIGDALCLERKSAVEEIGSVQVFGKEDMALNGHVYQQIKDGRFLVVS